LFEGVEEAPVRGHGADCQVANSGDFRRRLRLDREGYDQQAEDEKEEEPQRMVSHNHPF
jgi:hypothetical protein